MGKLLDAIDDATAEFIAAQKMFFVATAPLGADGHLNVSPKGLSQHLPRHQKSPQHRRPPRPSRRRARLTLVL
jgi:hypothetical protein